MASQVNGENGAETSLASSGLPESACESQSGSWWLPKALATSSCQGRNSSMGSLTTAFIAGTVLSASHGGQQEERVSPPSSTRLPSMTGHHVAAKSAAAAMVTKEAAPMRPSARDRRPTGAPPAAEVSSGWLEGGSGATSLKELGPAQRGGRGTMSAQHSTW